MGAQLFRKYVSNSIVFCYRSVVRHPFLVGMLVFLFSMYRLFPLLFSILLSASPVLVSTAVLLGTLLSFGQPNIPEIEKEPQSERTEIVGKDGCFRLDETNGSRIEVADRSFQEISKIHDDDNNCVEGESAVNLVDDDGLLQFGEEKSEKDEERVVLGSRYSPLQQSEDEHIVLESDKLWEGSADPLNSNSGLLWKGVEGNGRRGDDDDEDDEDDGDGDGDGDGDDDEGSDSGDSGSDVAESSSPDASMVDIIPMLDELHPLLSEEQETHQPSHMSHDGTDAVSEHSLESSDTSSESNDDTGIEKHENLKHEDKESEHVDKEDDTRSAITWTEDDQKNLMDLGTSEIERNRRLEDLIERRRAQKNGDSEDEDTESEHIDKEDDTRSPITWTEDDQKNFMNLGTSDLERNRHLENLIEKRRAQKNGNGEGEDEDTESEHVDKEDDSRSPITWTEDDQKNLMNLGTSELERNRHLENLIEKRRAQKNGDGEDEDTESEHVDKEDDSRSPITWTEDDQKNVMNLGTSELERNLHLENLIKKRRAQKIGDGDDEDTESEQVDKEDDTRSPITWTEDDQKNLMNLGTSELERNRRLENLIARRRARKTMRLQADKNLADLGSADLPWNIPPISTSRNNPFDYDANDNIPGSAPSVLSQRRDPFDLPYDSSEEKPDLVGDSFEQEFATFQPKEPVFRRHESFNVGPSVFAASRSERQESRLKPYFVPERSFATFQRQFSGLSDSKASSVPDTESASSDVENKDQAEDDDVSLEAEHGSVIEEHASDHISHRRPYFVPEHVASDETSFTSFQRQLSEVSESKVSSEPDTDSDSSTSDLENKDHIDLSLEPDLISVEDHEQASEIIEHASEHVSLLSESFEEDGNIDPRRLREAEISVESVTNQQELHSSGSSLSSSDEASEQIYNDKEGDEVATASVSETNLFLDRGSSIERSETDVSSLLVEESRPNEPVYDLSPRSVTRDLSSSSISIDLHKDESFQHIDDHNQSSSSVSDVKWNFAESSSEIGDAQNQLPVVPDNEEHVLAVDNISTSQLNKPVLEADDVVLDLNASRELEEVQVSSSHSHARSHESFQQEYVMSQPDEEPLLGRSSDKPLAEDPEKLQAHDLEHGEVALPSPNHGEDITPPQKEFPLLDMSPSEPSEENPEVLQVHITSNNIDNLQMQEPDVVEVTDIETKTQEIPAYASDTHSTESNIDEDEIKEIDEDLLVELDAVGDFSVNDFGSTSNVMKEDPHTSEHDLENKGIADEDSYNNDFESNLSEMEQYPHVSEHDLETNHSVDEDSYSKDLGSTFDEMKQEHDIGTNSSEDEDSDSKALGTVLDERKQDPFVIDHDLETRHSEEDSYSKDTTLIEMKQDPHDSNRDLETTHSKDEDFYSKDATLVEMKQDPHDSNHDLEAKHSEEIKQDPPVLDHDLEAKHSEDFDSYSKDATLDVMKLDPHDSNHDLETKRSEDVDLYSKDATLDEMKQDPHDADHDPETKHSEEMKQDPPASVRDLETRHFEEMKQDPPASDHDHETKRSEDEDSYSKDATLYEKKQDPHIHDLETKQSGDEDSYSKDFGSTLDEMKQDPHASEHDLQTNRSIDEDSYTKDLDTTFKEMKQGTHALEHRLETFYSVDDNFYSQHVESTFNEKKQDLQPSDQVLETNCSGEPKIEMDAEVMKSQNENDISNNTVEGAFQIESPKSKLTSDANEVALPHETESTTSLASSAGATAVNHGTENASSTSSNTDKE